MTDFATARRMMVDGQVRVGDVTDLRILAAMQELPREAFVPPDKAALAYLDLDLAVTASAPDRPARHLLKPLVLAKLIQAAEIRPGEHVLDVGCATGYSSALLARLGGSVVALEVDAELARAARAALARVGASGIDVVTGPLADGWTQRAPYDAIVLQGATEIRPTVLFDQLKPAGRLVCVQGRGPAAQAMLYRSVAGDVSGRPIFDASAPLLPGAFVEAPAFVF